MSRRREFAQGEQLPSERELMTFFNVGRPSGREALVQVLDLHNIAPGHVSFMIKKARRLAPAGSVRDPDKRSVRGC